MEGTHLEMRMFFFYTAKRDKGFTKEAAANLSQLSKCTRYGRERPKG